MDCKSATEFLTNQTSLDGLQIRSSNLVTQLKHHSQPQGTDCKSAAEFLTNQTWLDGLQIRSSNLVLQLKRHSQPQGTDYKSAPAVGYC